MVGRSTREPSSHAFAGRDANADARVTRIAAGKLSFPMRLSAPQDRTIFAVQSVAQNTEQLFVIYPSSEDVRFAQGVVHCASQNEQDSSRCELASRRHIDSHELRQAPFFSRNCG